MDNDFDIILIILFVALLSYVLLFRIDDDE